MPFRMEFDKFIKFRNDNKLRFLYIEKPDKFTFIVLLEAHIFYTDITLKEIQKKHGTSPRVMDIFRTTYLSGGIEIESLETGAVSKQIAELDVTELKETLENFIVNFEEKITSTTTGGSGTAGQALIPVRMGDGKAKRCMSCGNIILSSETSCPACGSSNITKETVEMSMEKWVGWDFAMDVKYIIQFLKSYDFSQITTLTEGKVKKVRRAMIKGIEEGWSVNNLEDELEKITKDENTAKMIARTELIRAANEGALLRYKENVNLEKVKWIAVPSQPGGRTCPKCLERNGKIYLIKDAEGQIPIHPYCRCVWSPVVE